MSTLALRLRVRSLGQYLLVSVAAGLSGALIGNRLTPVPGQLFADIGGVPLIYLAPVVVAVSVAHVRPVGTYWPETGSVSTLPATVIAVGLAIAFTPAVLVTGADEVSLVAARNGVLLTSLAVLVRHVRGAPESTASVLLPSFAVWTFGWTALGEPQDWALLITPASSPLALVLTVSAAVGAWLRLSRHDP